MAHIVRSGAFLQQCWSVHPLCVAVKRMEERRTMALSCSSCKSVHYLTVDTVTPHDPATYREAAGSHAEGGAPGELLIDACIATHRTSISLREMDVFRDLVVLRCADCRRHYAVQVSAFETHQR